MAFDPTTSILAGMTTQQVQAALTSAQTAYAQLVAGNKVASASYTQGDGAKSVSYTQANIANLVAFIRLAQAQLGIISQPRRPVRFNFR